ncbi:DegT/DnrJ/EryC1/StrS family aminotransferase [Rossellomorea sp. NS-SX7]|uniref:DegT/DnrJ/EryC1/StrS family aminotransferase n=1 Tax=Rossellomorea sp. NS-SX7 TaxID=3463856 RepID=UPI00405919B5
MTMDRIFLSPPHMTGNELDYINKAFETNWIAPLGPNVNEFEANIAKYVGVESAAAVSSGTAGLHLALELLEVKQGDIVFCSSLTFAASANPIKYQGATPVFIDSEEETWNMCPVALRRAFDKYEGLGKRPKAVMIVDLYGQSANMDELTEICNHYGVPIIEDSAESLGASYKNRKSGSFGKISVFSFNGNKIITTSGGGMMVSDDPALMEKAKFLATQARDKAVHYEHSHVGYNYRLSNILAGVGIAQLNALDDRVKIRREIFERYVEGFTDIEGIYPMPEPAGYYSTRWLSVFTIDVDQAGKTPHEIISELEGHNIEARPVWKPMHLQPIFKEYDYVTAGDKDVSESLFLKGICLPSGSSMSIEDQEKVIQIIKNFVKS